MRGAITNGAVTEIPMIDRKGNTVAFAKIDTADLPVVMSASERWHRLKGNGSGPYACARVGSVVILMHRLITNAPPDMVVDHINHDPLDNRRENLRVVTQVDNQQNRLGANKNSSTGVRGVRLTDKKSKPYRATVIVGGTKINVGYFSTLESAEEAAMQARQKLFTNAPENLAH